MNKITKKAFSFNKKKMISGIFLSILLILMSIMIIIGVMEINIFSIQFSYDKNHSGVLIGIVAIINLIIWILMFIDSLYKLFVKNPAIIIDEDGIHLNINKSILIEWNEIREVFIYNTTVKNSTRRSIGIEPKVSCCFQNKYTGFRRWAFSCGGNTKILISEIYIDVDIEKLYEIIIEDWNNQRYLRN